MVAPSLIHHRPQRSPFGWLGLVLLSLGLHGLGLVGLWPWLTQLGQATPATPAIAVELIDLPPRSQPLAPPNPARPDRPTAPIRQPDPVFTSEPAIAPRPEITSPNQEVTAADRREDLQDETDQSSTESNTESSSEINNETSDELQDEGNTEAVADTNPPEQAEVTDRGEPPMPEDDDLGLETLPDVPNVPNPNQWERGTLDTANTSPIPPGAGSRTQTYRIDDLRTEELLDGDRHLYDQPPQLIDYAREFIDDPTQTTCEITPAIRASLGDRVQLQVSLTAEGEVDQVRSLNVPPIAPDYDRFLDCLLRTWDFSPAERAGQPVASDALIVELSLMDAES
jgi:hypothetical protein